MLSLTKYYCRLLIFSALIVLSASCKKGWLDETSSAQISSEAQFSTEGGFLDALMGVYISMTQPDGYSRDMGWFLMDHLSRTFVTSIYSYDYLDFENFNYYSTRSKPVVDRIWARAYHTIANINNALNALEEKKAILDPINYTLIKGELLALRAFNHFELMRVFGHSGYANRPELASKKAIPYATEYSKKFPDQYSYQETFLKMENDINAALELLKKDDPIYTKTSRPAGYYDHVNRNGFYDNRELRMNYYAALALKARVLMWQGTAEKKAQALTIAREVINDAPAALITSNPGNNHVLKGEDLFTLNVQRLDEIADLYLNGNNQTLGGAAYLIQAMADEIYETANPNIGLVDYRYTTLLELQMLGRVPIRLRQAGKSIESGYRERLPMIRISEMYYIAAEAQLETNLAGAIADLNTVRRARGIIDDIDAGASKQTVEEEITKEYRKDFVSEGQLFYYYKRKGFTTFSGLPTGKVADDALYMLPYPDNEFEFGGRVQ